MPTILAQNVALLARATDSPNSIYATLREQVFVALYPPTTAGYRNRMIGFIAVAC